MHAHPDHPARRLTQWGLAAALGLGATAALATTSSSSVQITSFSASASAGTLSWLDPYQSFATTALNAGGLLGADSDSYDTDDYGFAVVGASTTRASAAVSTFTPQIFWATADTSSSVGALTNLPNQGQATALQSGSFTLSGAGTVTISIGYVLDVASVGGNPVSDYGSAQATFNLADGEGSSNLTQSLLSFAQASGIGHSVGTFTLTVALAAGETGYYTLQGSALAFSTAAAVPEPMSWLLLGCGLAAMGAWVRPRRQA